MAGAVTTAVGVALMLGTLAAQAPQFKRTILQQKDLSAPGREAVMAAVEFPAGSETGRHTHPGEEISFVEAGPFVLEVDGQPAKTLQTGEPFFVPAGVIHNGHPEAGKTAKVVATYVIEKGKPVSTPAPAK
ncbi:MAG: cupin domain-containing protein [Acidobacteria bacterium]|nr:cupin domain-containing protein [Acidobacteriota bacterium]